MLLSIIIPVYNLEKYIEKCIDSITKQLTEEVEIIIVNDGSNDRSEEICKKYNQQYQNIKYIYQHNSGVSTARNNGIKEASGDYIFFVDGDDWITESSISNVISILKKEKPDIISTDFFKAYRETYTENTKKMLKRKKKIQLFNQYTHPQTIYKILEYNLFNPSLCCNVFKKELFYKFNIFLEENVKFTEDMDCAFKLLLKSKKIVVLEKPIYIYRQSRPDSVTKLYTQKRIQDTMNFVINWADTYDYSNLDKHASEYLTSFANYQYSIVVGMLFSSTKEIFEANYQNIKLHKDKLTRIKGLKGKIINIVYRLLGFDFTGKLLSLWLGIKDRVKKGR